MEMILDDKKFAIYGKPGADGKGRPKLGFSVYNGNPNITVFTNDPNDTEKKPIRAGMDSLSFGALIAAWEEVIVGPNNNSIQVINRSGPPTKTFVDTTVIVGKDEEGVVYIAVRKEGRPVKKFKVLPAIYYDFTKSNGELMTDAEKSVVFAKGWIKQLSDHMNYYIAQTYVKPQPMQNRGGGNRGGYNGGGNGGGGNRNYNNSQSSSYDDDLPM